MKPSEVAHNTLVVTVSTGLVSTLAGGVYEAGYLVNGPLTSGPWYSYDWNVRPLTPDEETVWRLTGKGPAL